MSDKEQIKVMWRLVSDGTVLSHAHERITVNLQAKYAYSFLPAVLTCERLLQTLAGDDESASSLNPRRVASYACDLAQQLLNQFEERGWLIDLPDPILSQQEMDLVRQRLADLEAK